MAEFMAVSSLDSTFFSDHEKQTRQSWRRSHSLSLSSKGGPQETDANILPDISDPPDSDLEKANSSEDPKPAFAGFDPSSFPDGGLQAWLVVSGAFCCLFCSFGWVNCIGVFQAYYQTHQLSNYSPSTVSWIPSLTVFFMFAGGPIWGKCYDNYGPRQLLLAGSFLHVFGLMMASLCSEYYQFILAQGVCSPIGASLIFYPAMSSTGTWFFKRRALAFGIMAAGSSLGGVILPIMVDRIIARAGFPWAMRGAAFLLLALLIYANLTVRSRLPPSPKPWSLMEFVLPFRELPFSLVVFASFLFFAGMFLPFTFVILSAQHDGMSERLAAYLVPILNAVSIFGRTIPGYIADKTGRFNTMIITCFLSTLLVLCLWLPARGNIPYILFAAFYGFSSGAFVSLAPALVAQISDIRQIGVRTGSMFAVVSVAALMGNPIGGALVSSEDGGYWGLQVFCGVMMGAGSLVFVVSRWSLAGWRYVKV
ncbi:MAG: hypothetical protein LQ339_000541 [Xanthoria mediterranea]|nr:MAG: hypothetical protein LQ339_000541 [Xanthoria mediterranea]